jgi:hypothetical protein
VLATEDSLRRWWLLGVVPLLGVGGYADLGSGIGMGGSSSLESSKRLRKPEETPPPPPPSSLESANRLDDGREPDILPPGPFDPCFFAPPYERLKLGRRIPLVLFLPVEESRNVVRMWVVGEVLDGGESAFDDNVLSENLLED